MTLKGKLGTQGNVITIKEHFRIFQGSCKYKNGNKIPDGKEEQLEDATRFYSFENGQLITFDHASADTTCPKNDTIVTHYNKSKGASASAEGRSEDNGGSR
jgi:hypothetical protein